MRTLLNILLAFLFFVTGVWVGKKEYPPYPFLRDVAQRWFLSHHFDHIPENALHTDVSELITFQSAADIVKRRQELITFIWGTGLPKEKFPSQVENNIAKEAFGNIATLKQIDRLSIEIEQGITSTALIFFPITSNQQTLIYHEGHKASCRDRQELMAYFLKQGFTLACLDMPLTGMNKGNPVIHTKRFGDITLYHHDRFELADQPFRFFLEPVIVLINFLERELGAQHIAMLGFSGGGWTTVLVSAIDQRIQKSFSVAGSYPLFLRNERQSEWGDFEQHDSSLYRIVNYPELYVMASDAGRSHVQIANRYDPCCFGGVKYKTYQDKLQSLSQSLAQGTFLIKEDPSHRKHRISQKSLDEISSFLVQKSP